MAKAKGRTQEVVTTQQDGPRGVTTTQPAVESGKRRAAAVARRGIRTCADAAEYLLASLEGHELGECSREDLRVRVDALKVAVRMMKSAAMEGTLPEPKTLPRLLAA